MSKMMHVYILRCFDGSYYTGVTSELDERIIKHKHGDHKWSYTYMKGTAELVFSKEFDTPLKAIAFEKQVKGWSRAKKEALIKGDIEELKRLSKSKNVSASSSSAPK
jgi:putative endonuclease